MWRWDNGMRGCRDNFEVVRAPSIWILVSENAAFSDGDILVPAAGTSSIHFAV